VAVTKVGPVYSGRFEEFVVNDDTGEQYTILCLADRNNEALQQAGQACAFYYVPDGVRLARDPVTNAAKYHHTHYVGLMSQDTHVGVEGNSETTGGVLAFTTTSRPPTSVLKQVEQQILDKYRGSNDKYWGIRTAAAPQLAIAPITSNVTTISSITPARDGTVPAQSGEQPVGGGELGAPRGRVELDGGGPMATRAVLTDRAPHGTSFRGPDQIDAWAWKMEGTGPGSVTGGENAYAALLGAIPSEIVWAGFHGVYSPIVVSQQLILPVWTELIHLKITADWERCFDHFSGVAGGRAWWFSADVRGEFNKLRIGGEGIKVEMSIDGTIPGGDKLEQEMQKRIDLIFQKFMDMATKTIFEPMPAVPPAEAPKQAGGFFSSLFKPYGVGVSLKARVDRTQLDLKYEETRNFRYNQPTTISSSLEGFYDEIKADPEAEHKYFTRLILGDISRKVVRQVRPVTNPPSPAESWVGDPVAFLSCEIGYPGPQGQIQWMANIFDPKNQGESATWKAAIAERRKNEVQNPPEGWDSDVTYVRRRVHLLEPPGETDSPLVRTFVEKNVVELDPPGGTPMTDSILEVRADAVGKLEVRMELDAVLEDPRQQVEVECQCLGRTHDGRERAVTRFPWRFADQDQPRIWEIYTGQLDFVPRWRYRVTVIVKGGITSKGMRWTGPWQDMVGNGAFTLAVPLPEDAVTRDDLTVREIVGIDEVALPADGGPVPAPVPAPVGGGGPGAPPRVGVGAPAGGPGAPPRPREDRDAVTVGGYDVGEAREERMAREEREERSPEPAMSGTGAGARRGNGKGTMRTLPSAGDWHAG